MKSAGSGGGGRGLGPLRLGCWHVWLEALLIPLRLAGARGCCPVGFPLQLRQASPHGREQHSGRGARRRRT